MKSKWQESELVRWEESEELRGYLYKEDGEGIGWEEDILD